MPRMVLRTNLSQCIFTLLGWRSLPPVCCCSRRLLSLTTSPHVMLRIMAPKMCSASMRVMAVDLVPPVGAAPAPAAVVVAAEAEGRDDGSDGVVVVRAAAAVADFFGYMWFRSFVYCEPGVQEEVVGEGGGGEYTRLACSSLCSSRLASTLLLGRFRLLFFFFVCFFVASSANSSSKGCVRFVGRLAIVSTSHGLILFPPGGGGHTATAAGAAAAGARLRLVVVLVLVFLVATGEVGGLVVAGDDGGVESPPPLLPPDGDEGGGVGESGPRLAARRIVEASESEWVCSVVILGSDWVWSLFISLLCMLRCTMIRWIAVSQDCCDGG